jgi:hypothetical protein
MKLVLDSSVAFKWVVTADTRLLTNLQAQFPFLVGLDSVP